MLQVFAANTAQAMTDRPDDEPRAALAPGRYDVATDVQARHRLRIAPDDLAITSWPAEHP